MDGFQKRTMKKRKAILDTSLSLFNQHGYKNVTIAQISKQAHVSLDTIYNYFESKDNLNNELLKQIIDNYCMIVENITNSNIPLTEKLEKMLLSKVDFAKQFSPQFLSEELDDLNNLDLFGGEEKKQFLHNIILKMIEQGENEKIITVDASSEAIAIYIEIIQYYITHNLASTLQISSNVNLLKEIWALFTNGLKK
ncbi:TetR/AcrR family transcriptional regulator [Clostridium estertheticum]|uniref:TetR/AcrR family transcriptional regulator n=1 Tax=Clostridium estertheticum TaxID=238834 RepID=UPI001CF1AC30|nr:TetR/AcrR family transcriptional regulator [Clostridium estertheticum]MCB2309390.1 TetR/AcrR family transcriptional regulator [Clostridium estertheticum]MCB2347837.1 TetR/AcrR family transcriptional regulator [Clostridium estertheticum]MCB2352345.1 TetR/AcrR family transcriptional regulator [Clostridium estertheticum]WAG48317.1 TetR/AcrR family transcriptional regulator [Clostridium estertheticum]